MADSKETREMKDATVATQEQSGVETPAEIASPKAVTRTNRAERAEAMAAENAQTVVLVEGKDAEERDRRAAQMAQENAATMVPAEDDEREYRMQRAEEMAQENAATAHSIRD